MIKHVILWTLKETYSPDQKAAIKADIRRELEALNGQIPGLLDLRVNIDPLPTSNADLMLDSSFESVEALATYATHPAHVAAADGFVRPFTATRLCLDFEG